MERKLAELHRETDKISKQIEELARKIGLLTQRTQGLEMDIQALSPCRQEHPTTKKGALEDGSISENAGGV